MRQMQLRRSRKKFFPELLRAVVGALEKVFCSRRELFFMRKSLDVFFDKNWLLCYFWLYRGWLKHVSLSNVGQAQSARVFCVVQYEKSSSLTDYWSFFLTLPYTLWLPSSSVFYCTTLFKSPWRWRDERKLGYPT